METEASSTLPRTSAPSSGAGCCEARWRGRARSSSGTAGSRGTAGTGTGNPSCSHSGNRNIPPDGRLRKQKKIRGFFIDSLCKNKGFVISAICEVTEGTFASHRPVATPPSQELVSPSEASLSFSPLKHMAGPDKGFFCRMLLTEG